MGLRNYVSVVRELHLDGLRDSPVSIDYHQLVDVGYVYSHLGSNDSQLCFGGLSRPIRTGVGKRTVRRFSEVRRVLRVWGV